MNTKGKALDNIVKAYIIERIDSTGYDVPEVITPVQKVRFLHDTFYSEYGYEVPRLGEVRALREWFAGLPSALHLDFSNTNILNLAIEWGSIHADASDTVQEKIINNWFNLLANKTAQLFREYLIKE